MTDEPNPVVVGPPHRCDQPLLPTGRCSNIALPESRFCAEHRNQPHLENAKCSICGGSSMQSPRRVAFILDCEEIMLVKEAIIHYLGIDDPDDGEAEDKLAMLSEILLKLTYEKRPSHAELNRIGY